MNILLTSAGRRSYLVNYFKEALCDKGFVHASNSEWSTALEVANYGIITPLIYDSSYVEFLLEYCEKNDIKLIISLFDIDLPVLSAAKNTFSNKGIHVIVSDFEITQICNDKWKTYLFLRANSINTPKTFIELNQVVELINIGELTFPLIVKPRWGMASLSIYKVYDLNELSLFYRKVIKEIQQSYLRYESDIDISNSVLIQEFINGEEYGLDIVNDLNCKYVGTFIKKKMGMRSGETDGACTVDNPELQIVGEKIANSLGHIANLDSDCFLVNGVPYVLELNCRFGGGYPFTHIAGVNLPKAIIKWVNNEPAEDCFSQFRTGISAKKDIVLIKINNAV